ncbi:hypothetical protein PM082_024504 [Marasmius tenuissimus]|nr:hypothetical protein PM082_024504 [Marasmius tenuissimus]
MMYKTADHHMAMACSTMSNHPPCHRLRSSSPFKYRVENSARPKIQSDPSLSSFTQKGVSEIKAKAFFNRTFGGSGYTGTGFDLVNRSFYGCKFWRAGA